ncbi:hypothetical protein BU096_00640 [Staphylococcus xylosus]|uniref:NUMOD4 domain-containing protein n=1 Tax=Staphylococcus xylosus TaxID=1288 RepID=UPI000D1F7B3F|nr:NUMOD4 domain-containing protein [Staphylococcus xylosus]PTI10711.1 hypothetical protein BU096_00640 [Staphylococcus xylosus]
MEEVWKDVKGYEGLYQISNLARVKSFKRSKPRILKPFINKDGYLNVELSNSISNKTMSIHRLVATAFIPNPNNKEQVNHIDEVKTNNDLSNLEWVTQKENMNHGTRIARVTEKLSIPITGVNVITGETIEFSSIREADRNGFTSPNIIGVLKGRAKYHKGYEWYRTNDYRNTNLDLVNYIDRLERD